MIDGSLFIQCRDGSQKKEVKDTLLECFGGDACPSNDYVHLFVYNTNRSGKCYWDARYCVGNNISSYIDATEFFALYETRDEFDVDISQLL